MYSGERRPFSRQMRGSFAPSRPLKSHSPVSRTKARTPRKLQTYVPAFAYRPHAALNIGGDSLITDRRAGRERDGSEESPTITPSDRKAYFQSVHLEKLPVLPTAVNLCESPDVSTPYNEYESFISASPTKPFEPPKLRRRVDLLPTTRESVYTDPETRKVFACVVVPSPVKSGSAKSSRVNTAQKFYVPNVTPEPDSSPETPASPLSSIAQRVFPKPVLLPLRQVDVPLDDLSPHAPQQGSFKRRFRERSERAGFALLGRRADSRGRSQCEAYPRSHRSPQKSPVG